jgi:pseudaminic acid biosynthesis-associated methylase
MNKFQTEQEEFWANDFGNEYTDRNSGDYLLASNLTFFSKVFAHTSKITSVLEFGSNIGMNLRAIKSLIPDIELSAIEINSKAVQQLKEWGALKHIYENSIFDFAPDYARDLTLIKTVLIHINPDKLQETYGLLYESSKKYICIAEYYNPTPVTITYRGNTNKLFKRDFAGEMLERFNDLKLADYGFAYRKDNYYNREYDDITWFLLEKK